ncbi:MAG TPA: hypothetical protein VKE42_02130 [Candidatus Cybelea sp.]|nr:hypothetical protein [Candidatus Cybelea sp.]
MNDREQQTRELAEFANADEPVHPPRGAALVRPTAGLAERVIGAQPVAKERNEQKIRVQLRELAAWAGEDWFYRFPVRTRDGGQDFIEGPSIKLANNVARIYGNCITEIREVDVGDAWVFYARFTDIESGYSGERAYRQRKGQQTLKTRDPQRALDQVYQIGQSKAIRNVIVNALGVYADFAFEEARNSIVAKIGKNLEGSRQRAIERINGEMRCELARVERSIGRAAKDWLAPDIARIVAMIEAVNDGMATLDETFPPLEGLVIAPDKSSATAPTMSGPVAEGGGAQSTPGTDESADMSAMSSSSAPTASSAAAAFDALGQAYEQGKQAKIDGQRRSALPGAYRDAAHAKHAAAWLAGHDGKLRPRNENDT